MIECTSLTQQFNTQPIQYLAGNRCGRLLNMLVAFRDAGVKRFVYAASSSTYGDHPGLPKWDMYLASHKNIKYT